MTEAQAIEAIFKRWADTWPGLSSSVSYVFDNEGASSAAEWVRVSVQHTIAEQTSMGSAPNRKFERRGNVMVQIFTAADAGVGRAATLAGYVRSVFEGVNVTSASGVVHLYAARTEEVPTDGAWCMRTVIVPFRYVDTR